MPSWPACLLHTRKIWQEGDIADAANLTRYIETGSASVPEMLPVSRYRRALRRITLATPFFCCVYWQLDCPSHGSKNYCVSPGLYAILLKSVVSIVNLLEDYGVFAIFFALCRIPILAQNKNSPQILPGFISGLTMGGGVLQKILRLPCIIILYAV